MFTMKIPSPTLFLLSTITIAAVVATHATKTSRYTADWTSLDARPIPQWYDEAKIGIFIHWGVFSVPSYHGEWFWENWRGRKLPDIVNFMEENYPPNFKYADFGPQFTAEFFNATQWADLLKTSGAEYVVFTTKHHEGYTMWPSNTSWNWNSVDVGPHRDLVKEIAQAVRSRTSLHFGVYHSLFEWFNPFYLNDKENHFKTRDFVKQKTMPELYDLVNTYHPELIWSDGEWEANSVEYWNSTGFLAWLYNDSPVKDTVVVNDRWGSDTLCKHGGYFTCADRYNPGKLQSRKWENALSLDLSSWGYRRNAQLKDYFNITQLIQELVTTVTCGGNFLVNVGPTKEGTISPIFQERLTQMGSWLDVNGEAIFKSKPWTYQNDTVTSNVWYSTANNDVYAFLFDWPKYNQVLLGSVTAPNKDAVVSMLGWQGGLLSWETNPNGGGVIVTLPSYISTAGLFKWVYVLKLTGFSPK